MPVHRLVVLTAVASLLAPPVHAQSAQAANTPEADQQTFSSADEAVAALTSAVSSADKAALRKILASSFDEIASGDAVADKASLDRFAKRLRKMSNLVKKDDATVILYVGAENWPVPFPIARAGDRWFFDAGAGRTELFDRRIGANELNTIAVCREIAKAQREYAEEDRDGDELLEYAQRFNSSPGKTDGLYWPGEGDDESPLGPLVASAARESYAISDKQQPFHGYYFRILDQQGPKTPGGAHKYIVNGNMIGGFALLAYPATWGRSGLKSFIINQQGKVFQKDLGSKTEAIAAGMRVYNPDSTWTLVEDE